MFLNIYWDLLGLSCGMWDLVLGPGIQCGPLAMGVWSLSRWTTREVPLVQLGGIFVYLCRYLFNMPDTVLDTGRH